LMLGNGTLEGILEQYAWVGTFLVPTRFGFNESKHPWMDEGIYNLCFRFSRKWILIRKWSLQGNYRLL
jgi:hypothetical protein